MPSGLVTLLAILALVLAACGGGDGPQPTSPATAPPSSTSIPTPTQPHPTPTATSQPTATPTSVSPTSTQPAPTATATSQPTSTPTSTLEIPLAEPQITLAFLTGKSEYRSAEGDEWSTATNGMTLVPGDYIRTLTVSTSVLHFVDGSKVKLQASTEVNVEVFEIINGGPPEGQRIARIRLVDGEIAFDVAEAPSPPNIWEFLTQDSIIAIHGTPGEIRSYEAEGETTVNILAGEATAAHVGVNEETGEAELDLFTILGGHYPHTPGRGCKPRRHGHGAGRG